MFCLPMETNHKGENGVLIKKKMKHVDGRGHMKIKIKISIKLNKSIKLKRDEALMGNGGVAR